MCVFHIVKVFLHQRHVLFFPDYHLWNTNCSDDVEQIWKLNKDKKKKTLTNLSN